MQVTTFVSADDTYLYYSISNTTRAILWRMTLSTGNTECNRIYNWYRYELIQEIAHNTIFIIGYDRGPQQIFLFSTNMAGKS